LKSWSFRSLGIRVLISIPTIIGCLIFLYSVTSPFLCSTFVVPVPAIHIPEYGEIISSHFWSFKSCNSIHSLISMSNVNTEHQFLDYWGTCYMYDPELCLIFVFMFTFQILTLVTGIASVFTRRRALALTPVLLCLAVIVLMTYVNTEFYRWNLQVNSIQQGYWLAYPSMFLFLFSSIVNMVSKRDVKMTSTPTHTQTQ
jgi:hypothetical protein